MQWKYLEKLLRELRHIKLYQNTLHSQGTPNEIPANTPNNFVQCHLKRLFLYLLNLWWSSSYFFFFKRRNYMSCTLFNDGQGRAGRAAWLDEDVVAFINEINEESHWKCGKSVRNLKRSGSCTRDENWNLFYLTFFVGFVRHQKFQKLNWISKNINQCPWLVWRRIYWLTGGANSKGKEGGRGASIRTCVRTVLPADGAVKLICRGEGCHALG